tara:strand:- start:31945 stop:32616 length:672 start_codon:yes stop_codon:yes gene_type:complete
MKTIDTKLTRDPRYVEALEKLTRLKTERDLRQKQIDEANTGLSSLPTIRERIVDEAQALCADRDSNAVKREELIRNLDELRHKLAVLREAVTQQQTYIETLRTAIGKQIATDLLPRHRELVLQIKEAALLLSKAVMAETDLRTELSDNSVPYSAVIRPMPMRGFDLRDSQSAIVRYLIEALQHGYIEMKDLPVVVRPLVPSMASAPDSKAPKRRQADGWLNAS